jgi:hypothetical protein
MTAVNHAIGAGARRIPMTSPNDWIVLLPHLTLRPQKRRRPPMAILASMAFGKTSTREPAIQTHGVPPKRFLVDSGEEAYVVHVCAIAAGAGGS